MKRSALVAAIIALLTGAYAAAGFIAAPRWLRSTATRFIADHYHRTLTLGEIRFNPFTLALDVRDISLPDADGRPMLSAGRLHVTLRGAASLWRLAPSFGEILLERPFVGVLVREDGSTNLADLARPFQSAPRTATPSGGTAPVRLSIGHLAIVGGSATYEDRSHATPFSTALRPIDFDLRGFSTRAVAPDRYVLTFATSLGERFRVEGTFGIDPLASRGHFVVAGLRGRTLWSYLRDTLRPEVTSGQIDFEGDYALAARGGSPDLRVGVSRLSITGLAVRSPRSQNGSPEEPIDLERIDVLDAQVDLGRRSVRIGAVRLAGGLIRTWIDPDGSLNLSDWLSGPKARPPPHDGGDGGHPGTPGAAPTTAPNGAGAAAPWTVAVPDIAVSGLRLSAEDRRTRPPASLAMRDIGLRLTGLEIPSGGVLRVAATASVGREGGLDARGTYSLATGNAHASVELSRIDLTALQPYLAEHTSLRIASGRLATRLTVDRESGRLTAGGEVEVSKVRTIDDALGQDFVKWERLSVRGMRYRSDPASLSIERVVALQPYARVIVASDRTLNIAQAFKPHSMASMASHAPLPATPAPPALPASPTPPAPPVASRSTGAARAFPISIGRIDIEDGSARYTDHWIEPHFSLAIERLSGAASGVSSDPRSRARIDLDGKVDRYAPIHVAGEANLFSASTYTDMTMSFKGVELTTATPYSARFAGYRIDKGKLSADITYHIENRALSANHRFVIDQLQLGERVESPEAVKLPVRLAVALLKDRHGVIDLGLPVTGSLDDPQFRLGPLVWKAIVNVIAKAAAAPFALLGKAFGRGPEIKEIDFDPGQATLDAEARDRLSVVAKALATRPAIELDVPSAFAAELDGPALRAQLLRRKLLAEARRLRAARKHYDDAVDEAILSDPAELLDLLVAEYRMELGASSPLPAPAQEFLARSRKAAGQSSAREQPSRDAAIGSLEAALAARIQVTDANLQALGRRRAKAIRDAVLTGSGIDPGRLFVLDAAPAPARGARVGLELGLK